MKPIVAVKDRAVDNYEDPSAQRSTQDAIRKFKDMINAEPERSPMAAHPDDYDLYQIGEYNEQQGTINPLEHPQLLARGKDLLNAKE